MKYVKLIFLLLLPTMLFAQTNVQKTQGTNVISNGPIVIGSGTTLSTSGTGGIVTNNAVITGGSIATSALTANSITITAGTGLSGGGTVALGGTTTLSNAGVTSVIAGTGVTVNSSTGSVTINATGTGGTVTSVATSGSVNGITLTGGTITTSGTITLGGTLSGVSLTSQVSGTLPVGNGGTGATTLTGILKGNGTSAFTAATAGTDYVVPSGSITGTAGNVTGTVAVANGGTGATTAAAANQNLTPATISLTSGSSVTVNWALSNSFDLFLTSGTPSTISFSNAQDGQVITIAIHQVGFGTVTTVTWPFIKWSGGTAPTQTATLGKTDIYTIYYNATAGYYYGSYVQNF